MIELFYDDEQAMVFRSDSVIGARATEGSRTETWVYASCGAMVRATRCVIDGEEHSLKTDDDRRWFVKRLVAA